MLEKADGTCKWRLVKNLYREWGNLKAVLKAFALTILICFVLIVGIIACAGGLTRKDFLTWCKVWGVVFLGFELGGFIAYYFWAWLQGGLDDWEYEMDEFGITGRKIVHNPKRMKVVRCFAWILMLAPMKPGQRLAMRQLLYDTSSKEVKVAFAGVKNVSGDAAKGSLVFQTTDNQKEIVVPPEDYAELFAYIDEHIPKPKPRNRGRRNSRNTQDQDAPSPAE